MDTKQTEHEIEWLEAKIVSLQDKIERRPSTKNEINDLQRQIREREARIAFRHLIAKTDG